MSKVILPCENCGKERLVLLVRGIPKHKICKLCQLKICWQKSGQKRGSNHHNWKGGIVKVNKGYRRVRIYPENYFFPLANSKGYALEHRLVMAKYLNRCLLPWEVVHHKGTKYPSGSNEDRGDNRIENLELLSDKRWHLIDSEIKAYIKRLEKRIILLESEMTLLQTQLEQRTEVRGG